MCPRATAEAVKKRHLLTSSAIKYRFLSRPTSSLAAISTELSRLCQQIKPHNLANPHIIIVVISYYQNGDINVQIDVFPMNLEHGLS
jgi:hypothetical protein